jgi:hypothetical protein
MDKKREAKMTKMTKMSKAKSKVVSSARVLVRGRGFSGRQAEGSVERGALSRGGAARAGRNAKVTARGLFVGNTVTAGAPGAALRRIP